MVRTCATRRCTGLCCCWSLEWIVGQCVQGGILFEQKPVFCDRSSGFMRAARTFELNIVHCMTHVIRYLNTQLPFVKLFRRLHDLLHQNTRTKVEYLSKLACVKVVLPRAAEYFSEIDPARWVAYTFINRGIPLFGWRSTNFVESEISAALQSHSWDPLRLFDWYVDRMREYNFHNSST